MLPIAVAHKRGVAKGDVLLVKLTTMIVAISTDSQRRSLEGGPDGARSRVSASERFSST